LGARFFTFTQSAEAAWCFSSCTAVKSPELSSLKKSYLFFTLDKLKLKEEEFA
jgi:hypothetical protein